MKILLFRIKDVLYYAKNNLNDAWLTFINIYSYEYFKLIYILEKKYWDVS